MTRSSAPLLLAAVVAASGCSDATAPDPGALRAGEVRLASGLAIAVSATPTAVAAGDTVTARVVVRNPTSATARVRSACTTLAVIGVRRASPPTEADLDTPFSTGCGATVTTFTLAPGDSVVYAVRARTTSLATGAPLPAGTYAVNAYSNVNGDVLIGPADGPVANVSAPLTLR